MRKADHHRYFRRCAANLHSNVSGLGCAIRCPDVLDGAGDQQIAGCPGTTVVATFIMYVAGMADDEVRAFGSVAPLKVGLLNDYPTRAETDNDTIDAHPVGVR